MEAIFGLLIKVELTHKVYTYGASPELMFFPLSNHPNMKKHHLTQLVPGDGVLSC